MKTLDMTPSWSAITPSLLSALESQSISRDSISDIRCELNRMAGLADLWVAYCKSEERREGLGLTEEVHSALYGSVGEGDK